MLCYVIVIYHSDIGSYREVIHCHLPGKLIYVHDRYVLTIILPDHILMVQVSQFQNTGLIEYL